jgi:hypothetical protein
MQFCKLPYLNNHNFVLSFYELDTHSLQQFCTASNW